MLQITFALHDEGMEVAMITALVTGSNKGIGLEFCRQLCARGDRVVGTCRQSSDELKALPVAVFEGVEVTSDEACIHLARQLTGVSIDLLVLNAGIYDPAPLGALDFDRMRHQFDVNALGPLRVTQALRPNLSNGAKLAMISSRAGSIGDNTSGGNYGYRMAKAALNMAGVSLARDLKVQGIAVVMLHPGIVDTDLLRSGSRSLGPLVRSADVIAPSAAVHGMLQRINELALETSGRFVHRDGQVLPW
jgi:NAD(P)-dependent dehydrogenase (short-subunit alcohol dehydrogenase family)